MGEIFASEKSCIFQFSRIFIVEVKKTFDEEALGNLFWAHKNEWSSVLQEKRGCEKWLRLATKEGRKTSESFATRAWTRAGKIWKLKWKFWIDKKNSSNRWRMEVVLKIQASSSVTRSWQSMAKTQARWHCKRQTTSLSKLLNKMWNWVSSSKWKSKLIFLN